MRRLLLVDDDTRLRSGLAAYLRRLELEVLEAGSCAEWRELQGAETPDLTIIDYDLPDGTAFDILQAMQEREVGESAIVLTGMGTIDLAVKAIKSGAEHFLTKPVDLETLALLVQRTLEAQRGRRRQAAARTAVRGAPNPFLGASERIAELRELAMAVVKSDAPVLIQGETGCGKGVLARWLHENGRRKEEPFVDLNCASFSQDLVASELFGHQRGAFTGAISNKTGLLEVANRGTLFLDEIGDMDLTVQPKLLKVLEERNFRRVGETSVRNCDIRLIAATHRNLAQLVKSNRFREDLRFRINTITLELPPLRERPEDIGLLAGTVLESLAGQAATTPTISPEALQVLRSYSWPGNIRELKNVLERALLFCKDGVIDRRALRFDRSLEPDAESGVRTLDEAERHHIATTLQRLGGRVDDAAKVLAVSRSALYAKLKKYGIRAASASA